MNLCVVFKRNKLLFNLLVIQKSKLILADADALVDAGIFVEVVIFAETVLVYQLVNHFAAFAAKMTISQNYVGGDTIFPAVGAH